MRFTFGVRIFNEIFLNSSCPWSGQQIPLNGYKVISAVYPQMTTVSDNANFEFTFGAADYGVHTPNYQDPVTFDSSSQYKVDTRIAGRYLSYKLATPNVKDFAFSGMDVEVVVTGRR